MDERARLLQRAAAGGDAEAMRRAARETCRVVGHAWDVFKRQHPVTLEHLFVRICWRCYAAQSALTEFPSDDRVPDSAFKGDHGFVLFRKKRKKWHAADLSHSTNLVSACGSTVVSSYDTDPTFDLEGNIEKLDCKVCARMVKRDAARPACGDFKLLAVRAYVRRRFLGAQMEDLPKCGHGCEHIAHDGSCVGRCRCRRETVGCMNCKFIGARPSNYHDLRTLADKNPPEPWHQVPGRAGLFCAACAAKAEH
jgi:hypothetical protein